MVCIDISLTTFHYESSWTFGPCSFYHTETSNYKNTTKYAERCCLSLGEYTLTCSNSDNVGWRGGFLEIQGHKYCHDFVGYNARRKITVVGMDNIFKPAIIILY